VAGFASYPLSILIGVHHAGLAAIHPLPKPLRGWTPGLFKGAHYRKCARLTLSATDVRMSGLKAHMRFDLVGSKIMTVYVAEIKGSGIAAFHPTMARMPNVSCATASFATIPYCWRLVACRYGMA
jgi:hypothetical protein